MKKTKIIGALFLLLNLLTFSLFAGEITGKVSAPRLKTLKDILVYIEEVENKEFNASAEEAEMDQKNLVFSPRVLPIVKGTTVKFNNADDLKHNVFGVGDYDFDLGTWTKGITKTYIFNKLGEVAILCNVHPEMEAYIIVLQNPYFALTDQEGNYQITNLPPGTYKLKTWHDRLRPVIKDAEVPSSGEVVVDFELKR